MGVGSVDSNEIKLLEQKVNNFMVDKTETDLIEILHFVQNNFGYIPKNIIASISKKLGTPVSKIYGVITFYSRFSLIPKGKYTISVCMGTACYVKGSNDILNEVKKELGINTGETTADGLFSIVETRCIGACGLAPVININEDVYGRLVKDKVKEIIDQFRQ